MVTNIESCKITIPENKDTLSRGYAIVLVIKITCSLKITMSYFEKIVVYFLENVSNNHP